MGKLTYEKSSDYLAIKNWNKYQSTKVDERKPWVKDWVDKDNDPDYYELTALQRYIWDGCCRLRGRFNRNLTNDPAWIGRALCVIAIERKYVPGAVARLIEAGFLVPTNQQTGVGIRKKQIMENELCERCKSVVREVCDTCEIDVRGLCHTCEIHVRHMWGIETPKNEQHDPSEQSRTEQKQSRAEAKSSLALASSSKDKNKDKNKDNDNDKSNDVAVDGVFDPLTFESELTSKSGVVFTPAQVKRILKFHFSSEDQFWKTRVNSVQALRQNLDSMSAQVPAEWRPADPAKPVTRLVGSPDCRRCWGAGTIVKRKPDLSRWTVPCPACEKHEAVYDRTKCEFVPVKA